jgi:hypothetical protein
MNTPVNKKQNPHAGLERKLGEPWVELPDGAELSEWGKEESIAYNQANRQLGKANFFQGAFDFLTTNNIIGDYYEFGCHRCRTFRMALTEARRHNLDSIEFFAFDSFEGLPDPTTDTSVEIWKRGMLSTTEENFMQMITDHGIYDDRVHTVKGFYDQSLTKELGNQMVQKQSKAMLVNIDCDLYESAVPVFDFLEPFLQEGTVIYIDDFFPGYKGQVNKGVARAFLEFQKKSKWFFERFMDIGWWGRSYIVQTEKRAIEGTV